MANYNDLKSTGNYDYSKGPKSIYFAQGDESLPAVVLNVPQIDDDDEWGGTSRIAHEKALDYIGELYKSVKDPYGSGSGLESEMALLIGDGNAGGIVLDLKKEDVEPSLSLGNVLVSGQDNKVTIGTEAELSASLLKMGSTRISNHADYSEIKFKDTGIKLTESAEDKHIEFMVNGQVYRFTSDGIFLPNDAALSIGNLDTTEINAQKINASMEVTTPRIYNRSASVGGGIEMVVYCQNVISLGTAQFNEEGGIETGTTVLEVSYDTATLIGDLLSNGGNIGKPRDRFDLMYSDLIDVKLVQAYDYPSEQSADPTPSQLDIKAKNIRFYSQGVWADSPVQVADFNTDRIEVSVNILPSDGYRDLGSEDHRFSSLNAKAVLADSVSTESLERVKLIEAYTYTNFKDYKTLDIKGSNVRIFGEETVQDGTEMMREVVDITGTQISIKKDIIPLGGDVKLGSSENRLHSIHSDLMNIKLFLNMRDIDTDSYVSIRVKNGRLQVNDKDVAFLSDLS